MAMDDPYSERANLHDGAGVAEAVRSFLLFVVLPAWTIPGLSDWLCHRRTKIERTSGTHESLTHLLMMSTIGVPTAAALVLEVNAGVLALSILSCAAHEAITLWDVAYAADRRHVSPTEQHVHSFLEVLPFASLSFLACLHWDQALALVGAGPAPAVFAVRRKERPLRPAYVIAIAALVTATIGVPYLEEFVRCYRVDRTLRPHPRPEG